MQNFVSFHSKYFSCCKKVTFGVWCLRTSFGLIGAERLTKLKNSLLSNNDSSTKYFRVVLKTENDLVIMASPSESSTPSILVLD